MERRAARAAGLMSGVHPVEIWMYGPIGVDVRGMHRTSTIGPVGCTHFLDVRFFGVDVRWMYASTLPRHDQIKRAPGGFSPLTNFDNLGIEEPLHCPGELLPGDALCVGMLGEHGGCIVAAD